MQPDAGARLLRWSLTAAAELRRMEDLVRGFVEVCQGLGLPIRRFNLTIRTLHPLFIAENWIWRHDQPELQANRFTAAQKQTLDFRSSPIRPIIEGEARRVRYPISAEGPHAFPLFAQYAASGMTEYLAAAISTEAELPISVSLMTDQPGGFTEAEVEALEDGFTALRAPVELYVHRSIARSVCATYIGHHTGPRVLRGDIHRGSVESLRAVVWFCDLRNFTPLTIRFGSQAIVDLLNQFFGAVGEAVDHFEGEILKFIGDAALAIFPLREGDAPDVVCGRALAAAERTLFNLAALNAAAPAGSAPLHAAIAVHVGEVSYGNIGAPTRLDFTVIGAAVNLAARLNGLAPQLHQPLLSSGEFAAMCGRPLQPLGAHPLKGIEGLVEVFGLPEDGAQRVILIEGGGATPG
jgi:adenylate cyclase